MAELLVKMTETADPGNPHALHPGDVVTVKPDGHTWGRKEGPPHFCVIRVSDTDAAELQEGLLQGIGGGVDESGNDIPLLAVRAKHLDISTLPVQTRSQLAAGRVTLQGATLRSAIKEAFDAHRR